MVPGGDKVPDIFARLSRSSARSRVFGARAQKDNRTALVTGFGHSAEVGRFCQELHRRLHEHPAEPDYYVRVFYGYIASDEPPKNSPVCTVKKRFAQVTTG